MPSLPTRPHDYRNLPSATARWEDLVVLDTSFRDVDLLPPDTPAYTRSMTVRTSQDGQDVTTDATDPIPFFGGTAPTRHFAWRKTQRHRPGLEYMASTRRLHAFESLSERRLLQTLDFAHVIDALSQPLELGFSAGLRTWRHVPDYLVLLDDGQTLLLNVKPRELIKPDDRVKFAAADRLAEARGWRHEVVVGYVEPARSVIEDLSLTKKPRFSDPAGLVPQILDVLADGPVPFGTLVERTTVPGVARAMTRGLIWRRLASVDLGERLRDASVVTLAPESCRRPE